MNTNTDFDKIDKVLLKIMGKELQSFVILFSYTHDNFATALVEKYRKSERGNYKEIVEACFAHVGVLGKRFWEPDLAWRKIEKNLQAVRGSEDCDETYEDADEVIKDGIKKMIAEYLDKYYVKNYWGCNRWQWGKWDAWVCKYGRKQNKNQWGMQNCGHHFKEFYHHTFHINF